MEAPFAVLHCGAAAVEPRIISLYACCAVGARVNINGGAKVDIRLWCVVWPTGVKNTTELRTKVTEVIFAKLKAVGTVDDDGLREGTRSLPLHPFLVRWGKKSTLCT